jgi:hypothetical protein
VAIRDLPLTKRLRFFPIMGFGMGVGFLVLALIGGGISLASGRPPREHFAEIVAVYPLSGAIGGILVALAVPLVRWLGGAYVVGVLAVLPMYVGIRLAQGEMFRSTLGFAVVASLFAGGLVGVSQWLNEERRPYRLAHVWLYAFICSAVAWVVGLHWAGQWPAVVAIFLFLIPVALALMITFAQADADGAA